MKLSPQRQLALIVLLALYQYVPNASADTLGDQRAAALQAAKAGDYATALHELRLLNKAAPNDIGIFADYIVVLTQAKQPEAALNAGRQLNRDTAPIYALKALARAARDTGQYTTAINEYVNLIKRDRYNTDHQLGYVYSLIDAKHYAHAKRYLDKIQALHPSSLPVLQAMNYYGMAAKDYTLVMRSSRQILKQAPNNISAQQHLIIATNRVGAPAQAQALMAKYPEAVSTRDQTVISSDKVAQHIRWGSYAPMTPTTRYAQTDKALAALDRICNCDWATLDLNQAENLKLALDRIVALRDRLRMKDALTQYQTIRSANKPVPNYALNAVGDAYLYLRQPEKSLAVYDAILKTDPNNAQVKRSRFYALLEAERIDEAQAWIAEVADAEPAFLTRNKSPIVRANPNKLSADVTRAMGYAYVDNHALAYNTLNQLAAKAPANTEIAVNQARVKNFRGWHHQAESDFERLIANNNQTDNMKLHLADTKMNLREYAQAEALVQEVSPNLSTKHSLLKQTKQRIARHHMRELDAGFSISDSSGNAIGSRNNNADATLYSRPIDQNYRVFGRLQHIDATFPEGDGRALSPSLGVEYRDRRWVADWRISRLLHDGNGVGSLARAQYRVDDYWSVNAEAGINTLEMPLRGLRAGTRANHLGVGVNYRWDERMFAGLNLRAVDMSDGNLRKSMSAFIDRNVVNLPKYKLNLALSASTSDNKNITTANYFNPLRDYEYGISAENRWLTWRNYDRSFTQRLHLGVGNYYQENFGNSGTWRIEYGHEWQFDNLLRLSYGIGRSKHDYDNASEYFNHFYGRINWLF